MIKGFNFRATAAYVTDGANQTYLIDTDIHPITRNGITFGRETGSAMQSRDYSLTNDVRLAGCVFIDNSTDPQHTWRVDLPAAGDYDIRLALGLQIIPSTIYAYIYDNATLLATIAAGAAPNTNEFVDANGVIRTAAAWPAANTQRRLTFASTILRLTLGSPTSQSGLSSLAHLEIADVALGSPKYYRENILGQR